MSKIIGLSGPQGAGKSTLLNGLVRNALFFEHPFIALDDFKVSRHVQKELGWHTLDEVFNSPDTMMEFQTAILQEKYAREKFNKERDSADIILTERTFADIAVYTQIWCWELVSQRKWKMHDALSFSVPFMNDCADFQSIYDGVIHLPYMEHVKFEEDPHRAKQEHLDFFTEEMDTFLLRRHPRDVPVFHVTAAGVEDRIKQVNEWIISL